MSEEIQGENVNPIIDAIGTAEEIVDPLEGIVERTKTDPGRPSRPKSWRPSRF